MQLFVPIGKVVLYLALVTLVIPVVHKNKLILGKVTAINIGGPNAPNDSKGDKHVHFRAYPPCGRSLPCHGVCWNTVAKGTLFRGFRDRAGDWCNALSLGRERPILDGYLIMSCWNRAGDSVCTSYFISKS